MNKLNKYETHDNRVVAEANLDYDWKELCLKLSFQFKQEVDMISILYLIGIQELGRGFESFSKDEKTELIFIGNCRVLSPYGYCKQVGVKPDRWPIWHITKSLTQMSEEQKENLLKIGIIAYFKEQSYIS